LISISLLYYYYLLYSLSHGQVLEFVFDPFGCLSLRFPEQLQIIVRHQACQIWFPVLVRYVFFQLYLKRNQIVSNSLIWTFKLTHYPYLRV